MIDIFAPLGSGGHLPSIADRIEVGDCWTWTGSTAGLNYGRVNIGGREGYVHRIMWEYLVGPIHEGMFIDHLCRNHRCCNPDHLRVVKPGQNTMENSRSASALNAKKTQCKRGHQLGGSNLVFKEGARQCRTCVNNRSLQSARRKRLFAEAMKSQMSLF